MIFIPSLQRVELKIERDVESYKKCFAGFP